MVDRIIYKTKDVPWHEVYAGDDRHCPDDQLTLVISLDILLICMSKVREVVKEACQALMADSVDISPVEVLQHLQVHVHPPIGFVAYIVSSTWTCVSLVTNLQRV